MHSQAKLIQHLNAVRSFLVSRHAEVHVSYVLSEGCICSGSEQAAPDGKHDPLHTAVKQLVVAEFDKLGKEYGGNAYMYPVRVSTTYTSESNYYGTAYAVHQGYCDRLALIDRWIADAQKKLVAAVFRKAIDLLVAEEHYFMCNAIKRAAYTLEGGGGNWWEYESDLLTQARAVLALFKPDGVDMSVGWYDGSYGRPHLAALRIAILNLCITEVTRGFK